MKFPNLFVIISSFLFLMSVFFGYAQHPPLENYTQKIAGTDFTIDMVAIPKGTFLMGSKEGENHRNSDEGPQHKVKVDAFWMSKLEITWEMYLLFLNRTLDSIESAEKGTEIELGVDAVSGATIPYVDMSLGMGKDDFPVVNVTQLAASKFCKWLSAKTGYFYRLPTEAEWEYACRAGTETAYSFGDNESDLSDYGWFYENSDETYHKGGLKKPNAWGLYDMHGNVAEWTLDQYIPDAYTQYQQNVVTDNPYVVPTKEYPRSIRGGSWDDDADALRSAARLASNPDWKRRDPQLPKSLWWNTDASFIGFRIIRSPKIPSEKEYPTYWGPKPPKKM